MAATKSSSAISPRALKTKLFKAAKYGDLKVLREVLDAGADVGALNGDKWTALHQACRYGELEAVKVLLTAGADPNAPHARTGFTPLIVAASTPGHAELLRVLVNGGAAPSFVSKYGVTAIHQSVDTGDLDALEVLLQAGGDPTIPVGREQHRLVDRMKDPKRWPPIEALIARHELVPKQTAEEASAAAARTLARERTRSKAPPMSSRPTSTPAPRE